jgi:hypothetical protein
MVRKETDPMEERRHRGFVVGCSQSPEGKSVWRVRVKDTDSSFDGQKLVVASIHGGLELARGLNVNFAIGTVDDLSGGKAVRAVDLRLEEIILDAKSQPSSQPDL